MKKCMMAMICLGLAAGCATNLEKASRLMQEGKYPEARQFYQRALSGEQAKAEIPAWKSNLHRYQYCFSTNTAAVAIYGIGNTYRHEQKRDEALSYYLYFVQFSKRHGRTFAKESLDIKAYIKESSTNDTKMVSQLLAIP